MFNVLMKIFFGIHCHFCIAKVYRDFYFFGNETKPNLVFFGNNTIVNLTASVQSFSTVFTETESLEEFTSLQFWLSINGALSRTSEDIGFLMLFPQDFLVIIQEIWQSEPNFRNLTEAEKNVTNSFIKVHNILMHFKETVGERVKVSALKVSSLELDYPDNNDMFQFIKATAKTTQGLQHSHYQDDQKENVRNSLNVAYKFLSFVFPEFLEVIIVEHDINLSFPFFYLYEDYFSYLNSVYARTLKLRRVFGEDFKSEIILKLRIDEKYLVNEAFSLPSIERYTALLAKFSYKWGLETRHRVSFSVQRGSLNFAPDVTGDFDANPFTMSRVTASWIVNKGVTELQKLKMMDIMSAEFKELLLHASSPNHTGNNGTVLKFHRQFEMEVRGSIEFLTNYFKKRNIIPMPISIFVTLIKKSVVDRSQLKSICLITANVSSQFPNLIKNLIVDGISCASSFVYRLNMRLYRKKLESANVSIGLTECPNDGEIPHNRYSVSHLDPQPDVVFVRALILNSSYFSQEFQIMQKALNKLRLSLRRGYGEEKRIVVLGYWPLTAIQDSFNCFGFKTYWNILKNWAIVHGFELMSSFCLTPDSTTNSNCVFGTWYTDMVFNNDTLVSGDTEIDKPYLSHFKDKCVVADFKGQLTYFEFKNNLAGVTFDLTRAEFYSLSPVSITRWLLLVLIKFHRCEILVRVQDESRISEAFREIKNRVDSSKFREIKLYVNAEDVFGNYMLNFCEKIFKHKIVVGIHFRLPANMTQLRDTLEQLKARNISTGLSLNLTLGAKLDQDVKMLVHLVDYIIIDVDIFELLLRFFLKRGLTKLEMMLHPIKDLASSGQMLNPNAIMRGLRVMRYELLGLNNKLNVMARLKWPAKKTDVYLRMWDYLNDFSVEFQFPFFINEAFDKKVDNDSNPFGWWHIQNYDDMDINTVQERRAEFFKRDTPKPDPDPELIEDENLIAEYVLAGVILGAVTIIIIITVFFHKLKRQGRILSEEEVKHFREGYQRKSGDEENNAECLMFAERYDHEKYEVKKEEFNTNFSSWIGSGNFGDVYTTIMPRFGGMVAVKVLKNANPLEKHSCTKAFLAEIKILSYVGGHKNILTLLGACTKEIEKGYVFIVTEYCEMKSLSDKLRALRIDLEASQTMTQNLNYDLYRFCEDILSGLQHLSDKKVIHGDLSARNVLLTKDGVCKISDFGLSHKLEKYENYIRTNYEELPWRWMSLESLTYGKFTLMSDIWSLGILHWEIFTLGELPYGGTNYDTNFKESLKDGMRLAKPSRVSQDIYDQLLSCWSEEPHNRPTVTNLTLFFVQLKRMEYTTL